MRLFIIGSIFLFSTFFTSQVSSEEIEPGVYFFKNKDWSYLYTEAGIFCSVQRYIDKTHNVENWTTDELLEYAQKRSDGTLFLGDTFFEISYFPQIETVVVGLFNSKLNNPPSKETSLTFDFGNKKIKTITARAPDYQVPWLNDAFKNPTPSWMLGIPYKEFFREIVPSFKNGSNVELRVDNKALETLSLSGFTKSFNMFEKCSAGKIKVDMNDPF